MTPAEAVVVADTMVRVTITEAPQLDQRDAKGVLRIPAAEATPVDEVGERCRLHANVCIDRRSSGEDWSGRGHEKRARRVRGARKPAEDDAAQQRAAYRSESRHDFIPRYDHGMLYISNPKEGKSKVHQSEG